MMSHFYQVIAIFFEWNTNICSILYSPLLPLLIIAKLSSECHTHPQRAGVNFE